MATVTLTCAGGGGGGGDFTCGSLSSCSITQLSDVDIAGVGTGDALLWDGSVFVPGRAATTQVIEWSWYDAGPVFDSGRSAKRVALFDGVINGVGLTLGTAGSTDLTVQVLANDVVVYTSAILAGDTSHPEPPDAFPASISVGDVISIQVNGGTGAEDLGVQVLFFPEV